MPSYVSPPARVRDLRIDTSTSSGANRGKQAATIRAISQDPSEGYSPLLKKAMEFSSTQITDPFRNHYGNATMGNVGDSPLRVLEPELPLEELAKIALEDVTLSSCIDAVASNVSSFGYSLEYIGPDDQQKSPESLQEQSRLVDLIERCNADESLAQVTDKADRDFNVFGHTYLEVGRDAAGNVDFVFHVPAQTMRTTVAEEDPHTYQVFMRRNGELREKKTQKHFRRFVQVRKSDGKKVYFKEFGDDRRISSVTGMEAGPDMPIDEEAVEIIWVNRYTPGFVYGMPKYVAGIAAIMGSKAAAMTNLDFFNDNAIPALAITVAGGQLTQDAVDALRNQFNKNTGRKMVNRAIILEARTAEEDMPIDPTATVPVPRLDIKPLTQERQGDALFQEYTKSNSNQIRQAFRLPPLVVGLATDYTRATAEASLDMAEAQVFGPERQLLDDLVNSKLLLDRGKPTKYWRYKSNAPRLSSAEAQAKALDSLDKVGAMTPNRAIMIANSLYGFRIPSIKEPWGDLPFAFTNTMVLNGKLEPPTGLPAAEIPPEDIGSEPASPAKGRNNDKTKDPQKQGKTPGKKGGTE